MEASYSHERPFKPQPFRQNLFQPSSPPRVSTDPEPSSKPRSHLHGLHHHHHRHHHHRHSRHAKDVVQSAVQLHPPTSFGDLLKQASRSKDNSPSHSRRESVAKGDADGEVRAPPPPRTVRPEDVTRERERVKAREEQLRSSLQNLSDQSLKTSRQLDDTYYSILEKVSGLRSMIGSLQELSNLTKELHENFQTDTTELIEEVQNQFDSFDNFETSEAQVKGLEERIKSGKEKADILTARLDEARKRVDTRVKVEAEWEARTTRRLRMLWGVLGTIAGVIIFAILFQQLKPTHVTKDPSSAPNFGLRDALVDAPIPEDAKEAIIGPLTTESSPRVESPPSITRGMDDDNRLRIFDEL